MTEVPGNEPINQADQTDRYAAGQPAGELPAGAEPPPAAVASTQAEGTEAVEPSTISEPGDTTGDAPISAPVTSEPAVDRPGGEERARSGAGREAAPGGATVYAAPSRAAGQGRGSPPRAAGGSGCWPALLGALASLIGGILLTLLILFLLNGTLTFTRSPAMQDVAARTATLQQQANTLSQQVDALRGRADAADQRLATVDQLNGQLRTLQGQQTALQGQLAAAQQSNATAQAGLAEARTQLNGVEQKMGAINLALSGMRDLLLTAEPLPTATSTPTPTNTPTVTPTPTATATPSPSAAAPLAPAAGTPGTGTPGFETPAFGAGTPAFGAGTPAAPAGSGTPSPTPTVGVTL